MAFHVAYVRRSKGDAIRFCQARSSLLRPVKDLTAGTWLAVLNAAGSKNREEAEQIALYLRHVFALPGRVVVVEMNPVRGIDKPAQKER